MEFTEIIGLIGCVTGCITFGVTLSRFYSERFKLKISFSKNENFFFPRLDIYPTYKTTYQAAVRVRLVNHSSSPVTVFDIYGKIDDKYLRFEAYKESQLKILKSTNNPDVPLIDPKEYTVLPMDKQIMLPLRLQAYDACEGYMFFPFFPDTNLEEIKVVFYFYTARRYKIKKKCSVSLHKTMHY